jgi:hypothetical protein
VSELYESTTLSLLKKSGAGGRDRTDMSFRTEDFESETNGADRSENWLILRDNPVQIKGYLHSLCWQEMRQFGRFAGLTGIKWA